MRLDRKTATCLIAASLMIGVVGLAGCGRKGALEAPPAQASVAADGTVVPAEPAAAKPDKPFFLDPLLD